MRREDVPGAKSIPTQKTSRGGIDNGNINASLRPDGGGTTCLRSGSPLNSIPPATRQHARKDRGTHVVERMPGGPRAAASQATASSKESKYAVMD